MDINTTVLITQNSTRIEKEIASTGLKTSGDTPNNDLRSFMVYHERISTTISKSVNFGTTRSMICFEYYQLD